MDDNKGLKENKNLKPVKSNKWMLQASKQTGKMEKWITELMKNFNFSSFLNIIIIILLNLRFIRHYLNIKEVFHIGKLNY
jgi:hypothetical protein